MKSTTELSERVIQLGEKFEKMPEELKLHLKSSGTNSSAAWFLGTKGENISLFSELIQKGIDAHQEARLSYYPDDPAYITEQLKDSEEYKNTVDFLQKEYQKLLSQLQLSGPFWSMRSIGHMLWDTSLPGMLGYFSAMLYNQNNVAAEASPVTTLLELEVGNDLCEMLGYNTQPINTNKTSKSDVNTNKIVSWGHITCDGSVANTEGLWMARNVKFYALAVALAIQNEEVLAPAKKIRVTLLNGDSEELLSLDNWTLLNLPIDEVLQLPQDMEDDYGIDTKVSGDLINKYSVQSLGLLEYYQKYLRDIYHTPLAFSPDTRHYSWPKAATLLGLGSANNRAVKVDLRCRMDVKDLEKQLQECLEKKQPVLTVIAVIGSTEESAVDPLQEILALREKFRKKGMEFCVHVDAAWGGYFAAMIRKDGTLWRDKNQPEDIDEQLVPDLPMSDYVIEQYKAFKHADSITVDPHKAGYIPYPAGGLCYRNSSMRNVVTFTAPVVFHGGFDPTVGVYGIEGSKPGAAAAATYLSHKVIRTDETGYGKILGECFFSSKKFYANLVCMNLDRSKPYISVPLIDLPVINKGGSVQEGIQQMEYIQERIINVSNEELIQDQEAMKLFRELGQDQTINTYMFNFKNADGSVNTDSAKCQLLNNEIYRRLSFSPGQKDLEETKLVVTSSNFSLDNYSKEFIDSLRLRLGLQGDEETPIPFMISTMMNPWTTATDQGSFLPKYIEILGNTVEEIVLEIWSGKLQ
ncbi:pyridoxal-dependent decarboxylase [Flammeovirga sp. OC4]|uniref:pyridoxal phosphate-dependent decarboxylase family protein n=1 Tax=Flammeovirga sp. OC4 TaxID=1382345 RepID=UPI000693EFF6|nr:pyridoxal-dependent decarboxylase [Flammeovirga sp. OC4]